MRVRQIAADYFGERPQTSTVGGEMARLRLNESCCKRYEINYPPLGYAFNISTPLGYTAVVILRPPIPLP